MVTFGSFALHRPPPQEEGGKHQGPDEARPREEEHREAGAPSVTLQLERAASTSSLS